MVALPLAARGADMDVHLARLARGRPEGPVQLVPAAQHQPGRLQRGNVARFAAEIGDAHLEQVATGG